MASSIVLITGANRGLGFGVLKQFLAQDNTTVIAAVRTPASADFSSLTRGKNSDVVTLKYEAAIEQDAFDLGAAIRRHGITHLDTVVANAAIANVYEPIRTARRAPIVEHHQVNVLSVISLFQATWELLKASPTKQPKFVPIGSLSGSLSNQPNVPNTAYGPTKTVVNWLVRRLHAEEDWITTFALDPGWVQTDMGNSGARAFGMEQAPLGIEESVTGQYKVLTSATREKHGGLVVNYEGEIQPW